MRILPPSRIACCGAALAALVLVSCSGGKETDSGLTTKTKNRKKQVIALDPVAGEAALRDRYGFNPKSLKRDEKGNFTGAVRSQYDGQKSVAYGGGLGKASYQKPNYKAKGWNGNTSAKKPSYGGNLDGSRFQVASNHQGSAARQGTQQSRFAGQAARTSEYKTRKSPIGRGEQMDKPTDSWTDFRRRVYPDPTIFSREEYEQMTIEQSRGVLGRD